MLVPSVPVVPLPITVPFSSVMLNGAFGNASPVVLSVRFTFTVVFPTVVFSGVATIVTSLVIISVSISS